MYVSEICVDTGLIYVCEKYAFGVRSDCGGSLEW